MAIKSLSIRIDETMLHKLHVVADYEGRSANNEILILIRDAIEAYEEKHGKIELRFSQCGERSNAAPAGSLPPCCRHTRLTIVRRGCKRKRIAGIHGEDMYTAPTLRSACSYSRLRLPMSGVEGDSPRLSLGDLKGVFSSEREYPLLYAVPCQWDISRPSAGQYFPRHRPGNAAGGVADRHHKQI